MTVTRKWTRTAWRSGVALMLTAGLAALVWLATDVSAQEQCPEVAGLPRPSRPCSFTPWTSIARERSGS
jgi:hypothetical protein